MQRGPPLVCRTARQLAILIRQKKHEHCALGARRAGARSQPLHHSSAETRHLSDETCHCSAQESCVTDCGSRVGGRNSSRFLSMQRPKPVDIGRPLSGFLSQDSREHSHTSGGKRMNKKESRRAGSCNRTSTSVVRELAVPPQAAFHL